MASIIPLCCFPSNIPPPHLLASELGWDRRPWVVKWGKAEKLCKAALASFALTSLLTLLCGKDLEIPVLSLTCHLRLSQTAYRDLIAPSLLLTSESVLAIMASYQGETPINAFDSPRAWETLGMSLPEDWIHRPTFFSHTSWRQQALGRLAVSDPEVMACALSLCFWELGSIRCSHLGSKGCKGDSSDPQTALGFVCKAQLKKEKPFSHFSPSSWA